MKNTDRSRSHSWWWDSHISPINSKWLQENVSAMNGKVAAMLTIIEEDADSFAQRAEMFYRKRPELISLLGEFHQNYRALAERHDILTRDIRLNVAPALQAQLGVSLESAQNSPTELSSKRGIDGFDIISPSYSYTGPSEFDSDSPSAKAHTDEDESSPLAFRMNNLTRTFGFKHKFPGFHDDVGRSGSEPVGVDVSQLHRDLKHYQEENKALITDVAKLKTIQFEFSNMQTRLWSLEAEDKTTKKKLKSFHEQGQKLEAENLKLNHSLITLKEEKSQLADQCTKQVEEAYQRNKHLESEITAFKHQLSDIESLKAEHLEKIKEAEASKQKLQDALTSLQEESEKDLLIAKEAFEQQIHDLQQKILALEEENQKLRDQIEMKASAVTELENELNKLITYRNDLEQLFLDSEKEKNLFQHEKSIAETNARELQEELKLCEKEKQTITQKSEQQAGEIEKLQEIVGRLEEESTRLEALKVESAKLILKLKSDIDEAVQARESLEAQYEKFKEKCETLEAAEIKLKEQIASSSSEISFLKDEKLAFQGIATAASLEIKELQLNLSSLSAEKGEIKDALEKALEQARKGDEEYRKIHEEAMAKAAEGSMLKQELMTQKAHLKALEDDLCCSLKEKDVFQQREAKALQALAELEKERCEIKANLESKLVVAELKVSSLDSEKMNLTIAMQQVEQKFESLQRQNIELNECYTRTQSDHQVTAEAAQKVQEELAILMVAQKSLQYEDHAKAHLIEKLKNEVKSLEEQIHNSREDNILLASQNEDCTRKLGDFEAQINDLKVKLSQEVIAHASVVDQLANKERSIEILRKEISDLHGQTVALNAEISSCLVHEHGLEEQINSLKEQCDSLSAELGECMVRKNQLELEVTELHQANLTEKEANKAEVKSLVEQIHNSREENILLASQNEDCTRKLGDFEAQINDLKVKLSQEVIAHASVVDQLAKKERSIEILSKEIIDLHGQTVALNAEISSRLVHEHGLEEQINSLKEQCDSLSAELGECVVRKNHLELEVTDIHQANLAEKEANKALVLKQQKYLDEMFTVKKNHEELETNHRQLTEERVLLLGEVAAHSNRHNDMQHTISSLESNKGIMQRENLSLKDQLVKAEEENKIIVEDNEKAKVEIHDLQCKLSDLDAHNVNLINEAQNKVRDIGILEAEVARLENKNSMLCKDVALLQEDTSVLKNREESLLLDLQKSSDVTQKLMTEIETLNETLSKAEAANISYAQEQKKRQEEKLSMMKQIDDFQKEISLLTEDRANLTRNISTHVEKYNELEEHIKVLENEKGVLEKDIMVALQTGDSRKEEVLNLLNEKKQLTFIVESLKKDMHKQDEDFQRLQQALNSAEQDNKIIMDRLNLTIEEKDALDHKFTDLLKDLEEQKSEAIRATGDLLKMQTDIVQLKQDNAKTEDALNLAILEKDELDNKYANILKDLQEKKSDAIRATGDLRKMQANLVQLKQDNAETENALQLAIGEKDALAEKCADLLKDLEQKKSEATTATSDLLKMQANLVQLKQDNAKIEDALNSKFEEVRKLEQDVLALQAVKLELEKQLHLSLSHAKSREMEGNMLQDKLADMQQENERLEGLVTLSVAYRRDAENTILESSEEIRRQREGNKLLKEDLSATLAAKGDLEQVHGDLQKKKAEVEEKLDVIKKELETTQHERDELSLNVEAGMLQLNEKVEEVNHLQEKLKSAEANKLDAAEQYSKMNHEWNSKLKNLEKQIEDLNSENFQSRNDLILQQQEAIKLNEEIITLQGEGVALRKEKSLFVNQVKNLEKELEDLKVQLHQRDEAMQMLSVEAESLQKTLSSVEEECVSLKQLLQKDKDSHDAAVKTTIEEMSHLKMELVSKSRMVNELHNESSVLECKHLEAVEELSVKEKLVSELQNKVASLTEENKDMAFKLDSGLTEIMQLKAVLKDLQNVQLKEVHDRVLKLQDQSKSITASHQEKVAENALLRGKVEEHKTTVSKVEEENVMLILDLAAQATVLEKLTNEHQEKVLMLQNENKSIAASHEEKVAENSFLRGQVEEHKATVSKVEEVNMMLKNKLATQATELENLMQELHERVLKLQNESKSTAVSHQEKAAVSDFCGGETEKHISAVSKVDEEKILVKANVSAEPTELENMRQTPLQTKEEHEESVKDAELLLIQAEESQKPLNRSEEENNHMKLHAHNDTKKVTYPNISMAELESHYKAVEVPKESLVAKLDEDVLVQDLEGELAFDSTHKMKHALWIGLQKHVRDLSQMLSEMEHIDWMISNNSDGSFTPAKDEIALLEEETVANIKKQIFHFKEQNGTYGAAKEMFLSELILDEFIKQPFDHMEAIDPENAVESFSLKSMVLVMVDVVNKLKEKVVVFMDEHKRGQHAARKQNPEAVEDERINRQADSASEMQNAEKLLYNLRGKTHGMEEENNELNLELDTVKMQNKKLHVMLSDLHEKDITYALLLKDNLLILSEEIRLVAKELQDGNDEGRKFQECVEKLNTLQKGGYNSIPLEEERLARYEEMVIADMNLDSLQGKTSGLELATTLVSMQHQEIVEDVTVLHKAVENLRMLLQNYLGKVGEAASAEETRQPNISEQPRSPSIQLRMREATIEEETAAKDLQETSLITAAKELLKEEYEALETGSIEGEGELQGLARLHINLGTRLHQVLMDEKLESELIGLKEERMKLKEDLQVRVEQVERMESELGELQKLLKEGNAQQGLMDLRQKHQWVDKRKRAEERVNKLTEELVLQRQQVSKMKETVMSWTEQQEAVTEELEVQVLDLVSKESAPTMDGWDDEYVGKLMEQMKSYKALTRRHSLDLQSVGKELMRVSSTIEITQRQLLNRPEEEEEEEEEGETSSARLEASASRNKVSSSIERNRKLRGYGLSWFLLLFGTERNVSLSRSNSNKRRKKLGCWSCNSCMKSSSNTNKHVKTEGGQSFDKQIAQT